VTRTVSPRFTTIAIAAATDHGRLVDLRVMRDDVAHFVVRNGVLDGPFSSEAEARSWVQRVERNVAWREHLVPAAGESACPTCGAPRTTMPREPMAICPTCVFEAVDEDGMPVRFHNTSMSGGFEALHYNRVSSQHHCWVRGQKCHADEARFGGIVIRRV
jgi:hypothetical protein